MSSVGVRAWSCVHVCVYWCMRPEVRESQVHDNRHQSPPLSPGPTVFKVGSAWNFRVVMLVFFLGTFRILTFLLWRYMAYCSCRICGHRVESKHKCSNHTITHTVRTYIHAYTHRHSPLGNSVFSGDQLPTSFVSIFSVCVRVSVCLCSHDGLVRVTSPPPH